LPCGIDGLDEMTCGGWLRHSLIVVRGPAGSGKTLLSALLARAAAARGERVAYYGFDETRPLLLRGLRELGVDLLPAIDDGRVHMSCRYGESTSLEDLLVETRLELDARSPSLVVFDGISSIEQSSSRKTFRQFLVGVASIVRQHGCTALLTEVPGASDSAYLSTVADAILSIGYSPGSGVERELRLVKSRGSAHTPDTYRMSIAAGGPVVARL
jgi:circadian clock protein KaiC